MLSDDIVTSVTYDDDAETRGRMRVWKKQLASNCRTFDRAYEKRGKLLLPMIKDFVMKDSLTGKQRALTKVRKELGPGAILEGLRYTKPDPIAIFSILKPRDSVNMDGPAYLTQDCVVVNYIVVGSLPPDRDGDKVLGIAEGFWTLEVPDHAIGRCVQRTRALPDKIIREAHLNVLRMNPEQAHIRQQRTDEHKRFRVRAGEGGFVCSFRVGGEITRHEYMARVFIHSWLYEGMHEADGQSIQIGNAEPGHRLVDSWLTPAPLRRMWKEGEAVKLQVHNSMPELLYRN